MAASQDDTAPAAPLDWVIDRVARGMIASVKALPYDRRIPAMGAFLRNAVGPLAGYRNRAMGNLARVYPDMPEAERRRIADAVLDNVGRTLIENYSGPEFGQRVKDAPVIGGGLAHVEQAKAEGRPVLFVTGHFGNHEAPRQWLVARGYQIGGLYRPMKNRYFNDHYARTMTELSGPVFPQGRRGTSGFARLLKDGGMGTLLFDVHVSGGNPILFLGQPALAATSAADIALKFDALVVPYFGIRQPDGLSFNIAIEEPIAHADPLVMLDEMNKRLEARIADNPEQWFWVHNRWKPQKTRAAATIEPGPSS